MKNRLRHPIPDTFVIILALQLILACTGKDLPTAAIRPIPVSHHDYVYSDGFYQGADGYYFWDGNPPPGDLSPAEICCFELSGSAPRPGTQGFLNAEFLYKGDQAKIDLTYSIDSVGHPVRSNSRATTDWKWGCYGCRNTLQNFSYGKSFDDISGICNLSLVAGGTGYARKRSPFGIVLELIKFLVASVNINLDFAWGDVSGDFTAFSDPGKSCDEDLSQSQCDDERTPQIEYCPVEGDPANPPYQGVQFATATDTRGDYGGYSSPGGYVGTEEYCVEWIDWWVSFDGGRTWQYDYRECKHWEVQ